MAVVEHKINEVSLSRLEKRENYTFFGLTVPYLVLVGAMIVIPIGWLFFLSFIGRALPIKDRKNNQPIGITIIAPTKTK